MTVIIDQVKVNNKYISIMQDKFDTSYTVSVCPMYDDSRCGYPTDSKVYPIKEKAMRRFRDLVRKEKSNV